MYEIVLRKQPEKYLQRLDRKIRKAFKKMLEQLESSPGALARPLRGELDGLHRVRVGSLRMILLIEEKAKQIQVLYIGPRGDSYK